MRCFAYFFFVKDHFTQNCYLSAKDLSHVPCKFFKVGGCTAGASCPFSHSVHEPGQQKEVCTWFVKGNCKFGHKCALAHILPGQSMAMDRKNKKAAQTAASSDKNKTGGKVTKKDIGGSGGNKLPLLTGGSTAPTRILNSSSSGSSKSGRPPINMSLKATISPSAPAPPLNDTDFASFATLDGLDRDLGSDSLEQSPVSDSKKADELSRPVPSATVDPVSLPLSAPRPSTTAKINDFGPIGSPPSYRVGQPISPIRTNGSTISPATSPRNPSYMNTHTSPSHNGPLSAPGNQESFVSSSFSMRGQGIPQSLGSGLAMKSGRRGFDDSRACDIGPNSFSGLLSAQLSSSVSQRSGVNGFGRGEYDITIEYDEFSGMRRNTQKGMETAVEDEELEDFLPSSLNDLLTPEGRRRRMSRSNSGQKSGISHLANAMASANLETEQSTTSAGDIQTGGNGNPGLGHRYSHSVPAPTLLADIKSIWSDPMVNPMPSSPHRGGIPSAAISATFGSGNTHADEAALSMSMSSVGGGTPSSLSMMSPSNASAAFLPGLHKHYLDAKAKQAQQAQLGHTGIRTTTGLRGASNPIFANNGATSSNSLANNYLQPLGLPSSVSNSSNLHMHIHGNTSTTYRTTPSPFDLTQTLHQPQPHAARPISNLTAQAPKLDDPLLAPTLLSPSSRALQSHAPGQSLPQGLAAGYSRIHALPPLTNITSPSNGSFIAGSSPGGAAMLTEGSFGEWTTIAGSSHQQQQQQQVPGGTTTQGLDSMFSRLSYAATTRNPGGGGHAGVLIGAPPGLARNVSGGKYSHPLSPLSGPVVTRDDDILFDMDK